MKGHKTILLSILLITICSCKQKNINTAKHKLSENEKIKNALTTELDSIQQNGQLIGFAVAIANQNGTLYSKGFGYSDKETKENYTENTIQHIASISKTLIGIALMKAQEMGALDLDDPIQNYLSFEVKNPNFLNENISIKQLANHTSGINDTEMYMDHAWVMTENQDLENIRTDYPYQKLNPPEKNMSMKDFLKEYLTTDGDLFVTDNYIKYKPGARHNYSNIGAALAALVLENATQKLFFEFTEEHILSPLGMTSSGWSLKDVDSSKHSRLYRNDYSVLPFYTAITYPDGMLISSSNDIGKFLSELIKGYSGEGTILSTESYNEYFREELNESHFEEGSRRPDHPYDADYSPAIFIGHSNVGYIGHSGGDAGVGTWMYFNKESKTGRFIVKNTDGGNDNRAKELQYYAIWDKMEEYIEKLNK